MPKSSIRRLSQTPRQTRTGAGSCLPPASARFAALLTCALLSTAPLARAQGDDETAGEPEEQPAAEATEAAASESEEQVSAESQKSQRGGRGVGATFDWRRILSWRIDTKVLDEEIKELRQSKAPDLAVR